MSLIKQIRIAISAIIFMVAAGCLSLSVYDDHRYMAEQLQKKNNDNANGLAITLSNIPKDPVTVELIVSAQFDMGHYRRISIVSPTQAVMVERVNQHAVSEAPAWFRAMFPIHIAPGIASIQSGWQQYGTLTVESEPFLAYDQLWEASMNASLWTLLVAFISYMVSGHWLRKILKPLDEVIAQAEALGNREFITIDEPDTPEFQKLVRTMNHLSERVKQIVTEESQRLSNLNQQINYDEVTGLMNQAYFGNAASTALKDEQFAEGAFWLVQLHNLADIDKQLGYSTTNQLIRKVGDALQEFFSQYPNMLCGRLAGGLFGVFSRHPMDDIALSELLRHELEKVNTAFQLVQLRFVVAHTKTKRGDDFTDIFNVMQFIFEIAAEQAVIPVRIMNANSIVASRKHYLGHWEQQFQSAIAHRHIKLVRYPVMLRDQQLLHYECPLRLRGSDSEQWLPASAFIDWASQLEMMEVLDTLVLEQAVDMLRADNVNLSINVSAAALGSQVYRDKLQHLMQHVDVAAKLSLEVSEEAAFSDFDAFRQFVQQAKAAGCLVGLEHVANRLAQLGDLYELGLDFVKFDASLVREIYLRPQQQSLLRGLCMMVRTMGIMPIAEGVLDQQELDGLQALGIEAVTGPFVSESIQFGPL